MFLTHHSRVDLHLVGQIDRHRAVPLLLPHGERVAVEPPPGDKVQGCRVWDEMVGVWLKRRGLYLIWLLYLLLWRALGLVS